MSLSRVGKGELASLAPDSFVEVDSAINQPTEECLETETKFRNATERRHKEAERDPTRTGSRVHLGTPYSTFQLVLSWFVCFGYCG